MVARLARPLAVMTPELIAPRQPNGRICIARKNAVRSTQDKTGSRLVECLHSVVAAEDRCMHLVISVAGCKSLPLLNIVWLCALAAS